MAAHSGSNKNLSSRKNTEPEVLKRPWRHKHTAPKSRVALVPFSPVSVELLFLFWFSRWTSGLSRSLHEQAAAVQPGEINVQVGQMQRLRAGRQAVVALQICDVTVGAVGVRHPVGRLAGEHGHPLGRPGRRSHRRRRQIVPVHLNKWKRHLH